MVNLDGVKVAQYQNISRAANLPCGDVRKLSGRDLLRKPIKLDNLYRFPRWKPPNPISKNGGATHG
jgi:hypothetical protein